MKRTHYLVVVMMLIFVDYAHAYTDHVDNYSITFPKGWVISRRVLSDGTHITAAEDPKSYSKLLVQVASGGLKPGLVKNPEFTKFAVNKFLPFARTQCPEPVPTGAYNVNFAKRESLGISYACMDNSVVTLYMIPTENNGYILSYAGSKKIAVSRGIETAINSFKILK
ncbi:hypothetical protein GMST_15440 [Geomonas silvestris]|uniref:Uncharacterized protein n=1 Tax=Geomonas silvestris TaxID=2740184 RepID=A0A6V8MHT9_9BACT|nr:hypothetical protein [Geomonas silvestris]GFO59219.1 hypothetical protein GMST_15440 [Geomonas silvestris]